MTSKMLFTRRRCTTFLSSLLISFFLVRVLRQLQYGHLRSVTWPAQNLDFDDSYVNEDTIDTVFRQSRSAYCSAESPSQLMCFHNQKSDRTIDSFCIGEHGVLGTKGKFELSCDRIKPYTIETNDTAQTLDKIKSYWYDTGPRVIFDRYVKLALPSPPEPNSQEDSESAPSSPTNASHYLILLNREGTDNPWHCLMEIMALSMTIDVLQMIRKRDSADAPNTQVIVLDGKEHGPFFDLWSLFAQKPTIRLADVPVGTDMGTLVIPLAGASNPPAGTFSRRVLRNLHVWDADKEQEKDKIVVTFIGRKAGLRLMDQEKLVAALERQYADSPVRLEVNLVDLAVVPFAQQVQLVHDSDVLAGVHGAGLTHSLWLRELSAVVEILPEGFMHKGFRNLAGALGHDYFSAHGNVPATGTDTDGGGGGREQRAKEDWHNENVSLDEARFFELMDIAIKSRFNSGLHNFDIN
ncbi:uncharacterized protein BCR38DRAFT_459950 [Pseudomassariella vexata]|uniref:EGF domain-specific O-linked N-acetylglucosamine transferase n=1 Tax=Pseudomassariella vexata TaxID=1141098 RepID=A0A1Y2DKY8_9PEZI|nr:uncharacterized protein BCR38DRAFT_459950 [Pseudomassariella vexata]ORY59923.1 hypothetical protein BCR38DRAFT_459950 [Pseudomassariella vexata]